MGLLVVGLVTESSLVGEGLVVKTSLAEVGLLAEAEEPRPRGYTVSKLYGPL